MTRFFVIYNRQNGATRGSRAMSFAEACANLNWNAMQCQLIEVQR